jgi:hypothetical protein
MITYAKKVVKVASVSAKAGPGCRKNPAFDAAFHRFPAMFDPVVSTPDGERFAVPAACCPSIPKLSMIERIQNVGPLPPKLTNGDINNA